MSEPRIYRIAYLDIFAFLFFLLSGATVLIVSLHDISFGVARMLVHYPLPVVVLFYGALCMIVTVLNSLIWPIIIDDDGIKGQSLWGWDRFFSWREIEQVTSFNLVNLHYWRLYSADRKKSIYIPAFLKNIRSFKEDVSSFTGRDHPLCFELTKGDIRKRNVIVTISLLLFSLLVLIAGYWYVQQRGEGGTLYSYSGILGTTYVHDYQ